jgi:hypothetical protein
LLFGFGLRPVPRAFSRSFFTIERDSVGIAATGAKQPIKAGVWLLAK